MIKEFFKRIGIPENTEIKYTPEFLSYINTQCVLNIAYENIDILENKEIKMSAAALTNERALSEFDNILR